MPDAVTMAVPRPRRAVEQMRPYHPPLAGRGGLRLDFNENTVACSPRVVEALAQVTGADLTRYPERAAVERQVAAHLSVRPEQVLLTNGVDEAIHVVCQAFLERGETMLLPVPTYTMYEVYGAISEARVVRVQAGADFAFPFEGLMAAIGPETKLIAIANPNSPTGSTTGREQILRLAERAPQAIVLADEAYFHFFGETVIDQVGRVPNLVVARTFSKAYGLAGLRLGALVGGEETMRWLRQVISPYSVNALALACLPAALEDEEYLAGYVEQVRAARADLVSYLRRRGISHWPSEANFVLVRIGPRHGEFVEAMRRRGVLTRDRSSDPGCDGCVRITVGTREQTLECVGAMEDSLAEMGWEPV
jgi:histidinol-phosphate aminotransferase